MQKLLLALVCALPAIAAPDSRKPSAVDDAADIAEKLTERIDLDRIDHVSARVALEVLQEKIGFSIIVDYKGFGCGDDPEERKAVDERRVSVPAMKRIRIETILRLILDQMNADYLITPDHIFVTTSGIKESVCGPIRILRDLVEPRDNPPDSQTDRFFQVRHTPYVTMRFRDVPLAEALSAVATRTGRTITLSADAADKARTPISLSLTNAPLESAVGTLAEAAGLRAYRHGNAIVVVSAARAKTIESAPEVQGYGGCCSLGSGRTMTLEELESIARLFSGARPIDATTSKVATLSKDVESKSAEIQRLQTSNYELALKIQKLTEEMEKLLKK